MFIISVYSSVHRPRQVWEQNNYIRLWFRRAAVQALSAVYHCRPVLTSVHAVPTDISSPASRFSPPDLPSEPSTVHHHHHQQRHHIHRDCTSSSSSSATPPHSPRLYIIELEQILVLILNHVRSVYCRLNRYRSIGTGPTVPVISVCSMSPWTLAHCYQHRWLLYMLSLINTYMNQCWCHHSHYCGIGLPANYHHQLQETLHISLPFATTGPGTESAGTSHINYWICLVQFFCGSF